MRALTEVEQYNAPIFFLQ